VRTIDFSSWQSVLATLFGLALVTIIGVGIRLVTMVTIQQRRERMNRQINERLRTLIAAYKVLGGSFTGTLGVDPRHLRDVRRGAGSDGDGAIGSDRTRRTRDAVEAALSDIILLGTEDQVRLATGAAHELVTGVTVHTDELVVALRDFIRAALDLDPIPTGLTIPRQGPTRPSGSGGREKGGRAKDDAGGSGGRGGGGGMGGGMGAGIGVGLGGGILAADDAAPPLNPPA
jgi:uncharacterized membrane protein YgcG